MLLKGSFFVLFLFFIAGACVKYRCFGLLLVIFSPFPN